MARNLSQWNSGIQFVVCVLFAFLLAYPPENVQCNTITIQSQIPQQQQQQVQQQQVQQQQQLQLQQVNKGVVVGGGDGGTLLASASDNQYRASYYPAGSSKTWRTPVWNRDSYSDAAQDYGYGVDSSSSYQAPAQTYQTQYHANTYGSPAVVSNDGDSLFDLEGLGTSFGGLSGAGLGGLGGLGGILGLKGLKGLGLLGLLKGGLPLLVLALPLLLLLPLILLFLPIPIITIPSNPNGGRTIGPFKFADIGGKMTNLARSVLESDKCVERISCEVSRFSKGTFIDKAVKRMIHQFETQMPNSLKRMVRAYIEQPPMCKKYGCNFLSDPSTPTEIKKSS